MTAALQHAVIYGAVAAVVVLAAGRWRAEPALLLILAAAALARACGFGVAYASKSFGNGFGAAAAETGLVVVAASLVAALAAEAGAAVWLRGRFRLAAPVLGLLAGPGAWPAGVMAVLQPLLAALGGARRRNTLRAAMAVSAAHGLVLPSPVMIAAVTILGGDWRQALLLGVPGAALLAAVGVGVLALLPALAEDVPEDVRLPPARAGALAAAGLCLAVAVMIAMLLVRSVGNIPSEPLGGGPARELALSMGSGLPLLLAGGAIMLLAGRRVRLGGLSHEGWAGQALGGAAPLVLLLGAAGGLQFVTQETHMAAILAEGVAASPVPGLAAPFLMAALFKLLQGSSLTAAISAAGIVQPFLAPLGLDTATGHTLAALAVGAGSMAGANINDLFFWLVAAQARLRPSEAVLRITLVTAAQAVVGLVLLAATRVALGG